MEHHSTDKYNVAWFKLAQCVTSGQKERALGIFKLLSHSLDDKAVMFQLEGDLLLSFGDISAAITCYKEAAKSYQKSERFLEAALIYDHLELLEPTNHNHLKSSMELYEKISVSAPTQRLTKIFMQTLMRQEWQQCMDLIALVPAADSNMRILFYEQIVHALVETATLNQQDLLKKAIEQLIELCSMHHQQKLQQFLTYLETYAPDYYPYGLSCLKK